MKNIKNKLAKIDPTVVVGSVVLGITCLYGVGYFIRSIKM